MARLAEREVTIRAASDKDAPGIARLNEENLSGQPSRGFMLTSLTELDVVNAFHAGDHRFYVAVHPPRSLVGFLEASQDVDDHVLDQVVWEGEVARDVFRSRRRVYIEKVVTGSAWRRQGIGRALYEKLVTLDRDALLYAFVAAHPKRNTASLEFHASLGFRELGRFHAAMFAGLTDYESALLARWE